MAIGCDTRYQRPSGAVEICIASHETMDGRITESWLAALAEELGGDAPIDRELPMDGRLYVDRPLPFLCVYRRPPLRVDTHTAHLVTTQSGYLLGPGDDTFHDDMNAVVGTLAGAMTDAGEDFLLVEIWSAPEKGEAESAEPASLRPGFRVHAPATQSLASTQETLVAALSEIEVHPRHARVSFVDEDAPAPPDMKSLDPAFTGTPRSRRFVVGVEVVPIYRDARTGSFYPFVFHRLRIALDSALKKGLFAFLGPESRTRARNHRSLGRRHLQPVTLEVDHELAELEESIQFLLQATPVDAAAAWESFRQSGFNGEPRFSYRPLTFDPELFKRQLFSIPIEKVEDASFAQIVRDKQEELDRKVTMLRERESRRFFLGSLQLYGEVEDELVVLARRLLERLAEARNRPIPGGSSRELGVDAFCGEARKELARYAREDASFPRTADVRPDIVSAVMVSRGRLLVSPRIRVPGWRVDALLQHEIGTHMVTYHNGAAQPLRLFKTGLAGYEELQEGLAVISEYLVGGLDRARLRTLAARVIAAVRLAEGVSFPEVFAELRDAYRLADDVAFTTTTRAFRGGGLVKDAIYLRGLVRAQGYLEAGGSLEPLMVGKIALGHVELIQELRDRGVLRDPPLRPRYLDRSEAAERLERLRRGLSVWDLAEGIEEVGP